MSNEPKLDLYQGQLITEGSDLNEGAVLHDTVYNEMYVGNTDGHAQFINDVGLRLRNGDTVLHLSSGIKVNETIPLDKRLVIKHATDYYTYLQDKLYPGLEFTVTESFTTLGGMSFKKGSYRVDPDGKTILKSHNDKGYIDNFIVTDPTKSVPNPNKVLPVWFSTANSDGSYHRPAVDTDLITVDRSISRVNVANLHVGSRNAETTKLTMQSKYVPMEITALQVVKDNNNRDTLLIGDTSDRTERIAFAKHLVPNDDSSISLGTSAQKFADLYLSNKASAEFVTTTFLNAQTVHAALIVNAPAVVTELPPTEQKDTLLQVAIGTTSGNQLTSIPGLYAATRDFNPDGTSQINIKENEITIASGSNLYATHFWGDLHGYADGVTLTNTSTAQTQTLVTVHKVENSSKVKLISHPTLKYNYVASSSTYTEGLSMKRARIEDKDGIFGIRLTPYNLSGASAINVLRVQHDNTTVANGPSIRIGDVVHNARIEIDNNLIPSSKSIDLEKPITLGSLDSKFQVVYANTFFGDLTGTATAADSISIKTGTTTKYYAITYDSNTKSLKFT